MTASAILDVQDVKKAYGRYEALKGVSLAVDKGEFLALVGPSGCGKTTLLKQIAGFEEPSSGRISIAGKDMANPLATILSTSMMLRHSFGLGEDADLIDRAVQNVLAAGVRTADIATPGATRTSTTGMGDALLRELDRLAA